MTYGVVYKYEFPNGMKYIGQHVGSLDDYWTSSKYVKDYIRENGTDGIVKKILCRCADKDNLDLCERHYQIANDVIKSPIFYNKVIQSKHFGYDRDDDEINQKISDGLVRRYKNHGHPRTGTKLSKKTKQKISQTRISRGTASGKNNPNYGKKHTDENIQLMRDVKIGNEHGNKEIEITFKIGGCMLFPSAKNAAGYLKVSYATLWGWLKGKHKISHRNVQGVRYI